MRVRNLSLFEGLYDMVLSLSEKNPDYALCVAGAIIANYDWDKIRFAINHKWHLYDLDRWELASKTLKLHPKYFKGQMEKHGITYSIERLEQIMDNGASFIHLIVDPLYEQDVEIMDITLEPRRQCNKGGCDICLEDVSES